MSRRVYLGTLVVAALLTQFARAAYEDPPLKVSWDGTTDNYWTHGNWTTYDKVTGLPMATGLEAIVSHREWGTKGGRDITIGNGAQVEYDWFNFIDEGGDFRNFNTRVRNGPGGITITDGASLTIEVDARLDMLYEPSADGMGTQLDAQYLNLDNGTFIRRKNTDPGNPTPGTSGGPLAFGTAHGDDPTGNPLNGHGANPYATPTEINLTHGGRIENDGQLWFGEWGPNELTFQRTVKMTINDGSVDLTGGDVNPPSSDQYNEYPDADLIFIDFEDLHHTYIIDFTGPGTLTTDHGIISAHRPSGTGYTPNASYWSYQSATYQDLWNVGKLRANGLSGLDGEAFGDYFTVSGTAGMTDYTLTSKLTSGPEGDYNGGGKVDAADYVLWRSDPGSYGDSAGYNTWRAHFGETAGSATGLEGTSVPEPAAGTLMLVIGCVAVWCRKRT